MDQQALAYSLAGMEDLAARMDDYGYSIKKMPPQNEQEVPSLLVAVEKLVGEETGAVALNILPITANQITVLLLQFGMAISVPITEDTRERIRTFIERQNAIVMVGSLFVGNGRVCLRYSNIEKIEEIDGARFLLLLELFIHQGRVMAGKICRLMDGELTVDEAIKLIQL